MTKYFTKFLPVEGTPDVGDILMCNNDVCIVVGNKSRHNLQHYSLEEIKNVATPRKAKLFLCSTEGWIAGNGVLEKDDMKVIGEISPEAIWIKEGDRIDINNISTLDKHIIESNRQLGGGRYVIRIKCNNCETFH